MVITQTVVRELLEYNKSTGELRWRQRDPSWFKCKREWKIWNSRYAGRHALTYVARGMRRGSVLNQNVLAHRIVWLYVTGRPPTALGFRNGRASDLRFNNLVEHSTPAAVREWQRVARRRKSAPRRRIERAGRGASLTG